MASITSSVNLVNIVWGFTPHEGLEATTVTITASGAWTLVSTQPWIRISQSSGSGNATVAVAIAPDAAFPTESVGPIPRVRQGVYSATLTVTDSSSNATCAVTYTVGYGDQLGTSDASQPAAPSISPDGGGFSSSQTVTLNTSTPGAVIYYTVDGSEPSTWATSQVYTGPFTVTTNIIVQAIAVVPGLGWSPIAFAEFVVVEAGFATAYSTTASPSTGAIPVAVTVNSTGVNFLVAHVDVDTFESPGVTIGVTDNFGNTWHGLTPNNWITVGGQYYAVKTIFYCYNATTGPGHIITATATTGVTGGVNHNEVSVEVTGFVGIRSSSDPFVSGTDLGATGYPTPGTTNQPASVTPNLGDLVFTCVPSDPGSTTSINDGFTLIPDTDLTIYLMAYLISPNGSAVNPTWTWASTQDYPAANIAVFRHS